MGSPPQDISHICLGDADVTGVVVNAFKMNLRSQFHYGDQNNCIHL